MDDAFRLLAIVNIDAGRDDFDIIRSNFDEMILETVLGIFLTVAGGGDKSVDPASVILKGVQGANKIIEKKKKDQLKSSVHEEVYQMTKDTIYKLKGE